MENKKRVIVYADWINKFEALEDSEAGRLIKHFFRYINDLNPKYPDRITEISFIDIQNTLKRDLIKWEKKAEKSRENGKLGGRPINLNKPKETKQVISEPKEPVSVSVSVSVSDSDKDIKKKGFTPPSIEDVKSYFNEKGFSLQSAEKAFNYYSESDWVDSQGNKIKNWKQKMISVWFNEKSKNVEPETKYRRTIR